MTLFAKPHAAATAALLLLPGCLGEGEGDRAPELEIAVQSDALYGDLGTNECSLVQRSSITEAHQAGMKIAMTEAYDACLLRRVTEFYKPCYQGGDDPFASQTRSYQYTKARDIMRSGNTADVTVTCANLGGALGSAYVDGYGDDHERLNLDNGYVDAQLVSGVSDWERADLAGVIWHEAMHQQGYRHDDCGYPAGEYERGFNSMPYIADRCMRAAGILGRALASAADGRAQSLGIGRHRASLGHLGGVGDNSITTIVPGPATRVRYCRSEGADGAGVSCDTVVNASTEYGSRHTVSLPDDISFVEVEPLVLLFNQTEYRGGVQALGVGEFRANMGDFATVGNDQTASIYVAPGARVRVCTDEGGTTGHGYWSCRFYERSIPSGALAGISYAEVQPVVTVFREADLYGGYGSFGAGRYVATGLLGVGDNAAVSVVVPQGLTARLCSDVGTANQGAGACQTHTRTTFDLGAGLAKTVSFIEVTPALLGTSALTVNRASGSGPGRVTSNPLGLDCTGACNASFATRTEVRLLAVSADHEITWTGCDRTSGSFCYVTMMGAKSVSVRFTPIPEDCYGDCMDACLADGSMLPRQCVQMCRAECS